MLILGRNFQVQENFIVIEPVGIINKHSIEILDTSKKHQIFPNSGRIHTPKRLQQLTIGNYSIYELTVSSLYREDDYRSHYYEVKKRNDEINLYEVLKLDYSFDYDKEKIVNRIRTGIFKNEVPLSKIIIETADKYLLGPFNVDYKKADQKLYITNDFEFERYFINAYDNSEDQLAVVSIIDSQSNKTRYFTLDTPNEKNFITELDIATESYIIKESLNLLRGQQEYDDLTRRVYSDINRWLNDITFSEEVNIDRLKRTINALEEIMPNEIYKELSNQIIELPIVTDIINNTIEERYKKEYEEFLKIHSELIDEISKLESKRNQLIDKNISEKEKLKSSKKNFEKYLNFMNDKKKQLEEEILNQYFNNLLQKNLNHQTAKVSKNFEIIHTKTIDEDIQLIKDLSTLKKMFKYNLSIYSERDIGNKILNYCLLTSMFKLPMFIVGSESLKLANIIKNTVAAKHSKTIIFDDSNFSIYTLMDLNKEKLNQFNLTIIPNIQNSRSALNLRPFLEEYTTFINQLIFTFDSFEDGQYILRDLLNYPILNINDRSFISSPFKKRPNIQKGQLKTKLLEKTKTHFSFDESLNELIDELDEMFSIDFLEPKLKYKYRNIVYTNQFIGNAKVVLKYFPFLINHLKEEMKFNEAND